MKKFILFVILVFGLSVPSLFSQPDNLLPTNNSTNISCQAHMYFYDNNVSGATWFLQVSTSSSFGNYIQRTGSYNVNGFGSHTFIGEELSANTKYYWRARTYKNGSYFPWSNVWNFTTGSRPSTSLISPASNATNVNRPVVFSWMFVSGAHYHLFIRPSGGGTTEINVGTANNYTWNGSSVNTTYYWKVRPDKESEGYTTGERSFTTRATGITNISTEIPPEYKLFDNYPNPFNPTTNIRYAIPKNGFVNVVVYDGLGREVETLVNQNQQAGTYQVTFEGSSVSSGVYFYHLTSGDFRAVKKMVILK